MNMAFSQQRHTRGASPGALPQATVIGGLWPNRFSVQTGLPDRVLLTVGSGKSPRTKDANSGYIMVKQSVTLPQDPPRGAHGYGTRMMSLAVDWARSVGFREGVRALRVVFPRWDCERC